MTDDGLANLSECQDQVEEPPYPTTIKTENVCRVTFSETDGWIKMKFGMATDCVVKDLRYLILSQRERT